MATGNAVQIGDKATLKNNDFSGVKGDITYTVTNQSGVTEAGLASLVNSFTTASAETADKFTNLLGAQQSQLGALAEGKQSDGASRTNSIVLYALIGLGALIGFLIWKGK